MTRARRPTPTLDEILREPGCAASIAPEARQRIVAELAALTLTLLSAPAPPSEPDPAAAPEAQASEGRWLTPDEAAAVASVPRRTIYGWSRRSDWRPFTHRLSRKVLRIEEAGFRRWLARPARLDEPGAGGPRARRPGGSGPDRPRNRPPQSPQERDLTPPPTPEPGSSRPPRRP